jgi:ATP-dependent Clp protease ATP-binding subunit ClpC
MALANQEAQLLNHSFIGTEHILLGLVKEGSGVAANILKNFDIDLRIVRREVENLVKPGPDTVATDKLSQTPRAKKVIEYAIEESRALNHNFVGTEHLLLGLIREHDGVAAQVLMTLGLQLDDLHKEVLNILGAGVDIPRPPSADHSGSEEFFLLLDTSLVRRIAMAAARESEQSDQLVTPADVIRHVLEQHFPPDQPHASPEKNFPLD